ncbi:MAG: glycosyltransferase [Hyphomonadaceae bacterium]|nr:glycosyltransferase [Hyphomonadaceae bacterium]
MCTLLRHSVPERDEFDIHLGLLDEESSDNTPPSWVRVHRLDCRFSTARSIAAVRRLYADLQPDVSLSFLTRANIAAVLSARTPCVISARSHTSHHLSKGLRGALTRTVVRTIYPRAAKIIAVSNGVERDLRDNFGLPQEKLISIPNPVDVEEIRRQAAETLPVSIDGPFILSAGRLVSVKNFPMLLRAFAVAGEGRKLVIAGEGEARSSLEALARELGIADRVVFPGFVSNPYPLMAAAEMFILSSDSEGYPNALIEAMAVGRPVIATNCDSGPSQILAGQPRASVHGLTYAEYGILTPVGDMAAMVTAMRALADPNKRIEYGKKGRERAESFSAASIKDRYWNVLRAAMDATPAQRR